MKEEFFIGLDFGGTHLRAMSSTYYESEKPNIVKKVIEKKITVEEELEANVIPLINYICLLENEKKLVGIGIAIAALFDRDTGRITEWPNNSKYKNFQLKEYLEKRYKVPIVLEDDANAAAMGEHLKGAGKGSSNMLYMTVSTGIGCGIILNNTLLMGQHGWAGEVGHLKVTEKKIKCNCGLEGCLQSIASGTAIYREIQSSQFCNSEKNAQHSLQEYAEIAERGEHELLAIFNNAGTYIGRVLANIVMLLDVSVIILGGGVIDAGEVIMRPIKNSMEKNLCSKRSIEVLYSELNDKNGLYGIIYLLAKYIDKRKGENY